LIAESLLDTMSDLINTTGMNNDSLPSNSTTASAHHRGPSDVDYYFVWVYVSPWILLIGVAGNILTLLVMSRRRLRGSSTCVYLSAMAVADCLALLFRIPPEFFEAAGLFIFKNLSRSELLTCICLQFGNDYVLQRNVHSLLRKHCTMCKTRNTFHGTCICRVLLQAI